MVNYKRYSVGSWSLVYGEDQSDGITTESADLLDKRTGDRFPDGAYRVKVPGQRPKVFMGESAWSDAARHAGDARLAKRYGR